MATAETARARRRAVEEAGWRTMSPISALAGTLVAFGAVGLVAAAAGAAGSALGFDASGISTDEWRRAGIAGTVIGSVVLLATFFFGGYVAGRMSRRAGARHGLLVIVLTALFLGTIALVGWAVADSVRVSADGVPTDARTWGDIGIAAAIAGAAAIVVGSIAGGIKGERWHGRLAGAVMEHREAQLEDERDRTRRQDARVGDDPVNGTSDELRDDTVATEMTIEEERERARVDGAQL